MENESGKELPFAHSLQEIAKGVFIAVDDLPEEQARKKSSGFYVIEKHSRELNNLEKITGSYLTLAWIQDPQNFHNLLQLITKDSPILKRSTLIEEDLRSALAAGATTEQKVYKDYLNNKAIRGQAWIKGVDDPPVPEAQARIAGLEKFQQKLLERTNSAVKPQS